MRELLKELLGCDKVTHADIERTIDKIEQLERDKNEERQTLALFDKLVASGHYNADRNQKAMTQAISLIKQMREGLKK